MSLTSAEILPSTTKPIEEQFRAPDGSIDIIAAQAHLQELQSRGATLSIQEVHDAVTLVRILRRTNTGPSASKKKAAKKPDIVLNPDDLLDM